ncbi:MAG: hypothetical protein HXY49_12280 [Ignavibacteriaceae bacterium]|nr:hypothetical protein [Ignavibacteriaceae bacterium]
MKALLFIIIVWFSALLFIGCSDSPSSDQIDEQYNLVQDNVKKLLGEDYEAVNFRVTEEGFTSEEKKEYLVKFKFDLNKPYLIYQGKNIEAELKFEKKEKEWECTYNSLNVLGLFNLLKI